MGQHTPGPWYVGAQNDMLYIVAGRAPSQGNDHPWHDAPRVAVAKVYEPCKGDCLPIDATANARLIAAAPDLLNALQLLVAWNDQPDYHSGTAAWDSARAAIVSATSAGDGT